MTKPVKTKTKERPEPTAEPINPFAANVPQPNPFAVTNPFAMTPPPEPKLPSVQASPFATPHGHPVLTAPHSDAAVLVPGDRYTTTLALVDVHAIPEWYAEAALCDCQGTYALGGEGHRLTRYQPGLCFPFDELAVKRAAHDHKQKDCPYGEHCQGEHPAIAMPAKPGQIYRAAELAGDGGWADRWEDPYIRKVWDGLLPTLRARRDQVRRDPWKFLAGESQATVAGYVDQLYQGAQLPMPEPSFEDTETVGWSGEDMIRDLFAKGYLGDREVVDILAEIAITIDLRSAMFNAYTAIKKPEDYTPPTSDYLRALDDTAIMIGRHKEMLMPVRGGFNAQFMTFGPVTRNVGGVASDDIRGVWEVTEVRHHSLLDEKDGPPFMTSWRQVFMSPVDERTAQAVTIWRTSWEAWRESLDELDKRVLLLEEERKGHYLRLPAGKEIAECLDEKKEVIRAHDEGGHEGTYVKGCVVCDEKFEADFREKYQDPADEVELARFKEQVAKDTEGYPEDQRHNDHFDCAGCHKMLYGDQDDEVRDTEGAVYHSACLSLAQEQAASRGETPPVTPEQVLEEIKAVNERRKQARNARERARRKAKKQQGKKASG